MNRKVKRYDPINSDGTCGMCIEDADYGAYVEYEDYVALEAENAKLRAELAAFKSAVDHVTADGKTTRSFSASEGWSMVHCDRLMDLHVAEERLSELERRAALYEAVERACGELPNGWTIELHMESGSGWVELYDDSGCQVDDFPTDNERLDYTINDAIDAAIAAARKGEV